MSLASRSLALLSVFALAACGEPGEAGIGGAGAKKDAGGAALDSGVPDAGGQQGCVPLPETCNFLDDDCDGTPDDGLDVDSDGYLTCSQPRGDCDNGDSNVHPGAAEIDSNSIDEDCDGTADNHINGKDSDGDGFPYSSTSTGQFDCNDDNILVGPGAVEVGGDEVDNNCNGVVDEAPPSCETDGGTARDFARAMGICNGLADAGFATPNAAARAVRGALGSADAGLPRQGTKLVHLSTGKALDRLEAPTYQVGQGNGTLNTGDAGFSFGTTGPHPLWTAPRCGPPGAVAGPALDRNEFTVVLNAPPNARSFSFDFNFMSAEFPEFVCSGYNDRFLVILDRAGGDADGGIPDGGLFRGNISFDRNGDVVSINNGFFSVCSTPVESKQNDGGAFAPCREGISELAGTGYDVIAKDFRSDGGVRPQGGGTGWLRTQVLVLPKERLTLRFIVLDEGDNFWDSAVLLDGFQWGAQPVAATPKTDIIE